MTNTLVGMPAYRQTIEQLERIKRVTGDGTEYWMARDVGPILGYAAWREFEAVIARARDAFAGNRVDASHHIVLTHKMMGLGNSGQRRLDDHFLSKAACYLIAMNGDPSKPVIAAAQAYFVIQTQRMEQVEELSEDAKRLALRDKVKQSVKRVSGVAQEAGVRSQMQGVFHDARYQGLYGMGLRELKRFKGLKDNEQLFDRAGPLELSANDFQMNLAADVIKREKIKGEQAAIARNKTVATHVRNTITQSQGTLPEKLPLEPPIKEVQKRLKAQGKLPPPTDLSNT